MRHDHRSGALRGEPMTGRDSIFELVRSGNLELVREVLAHDPRVAAERDAHGISAVMHACYRQNADILAALVDADPPLDVFDAAAIGRTARLLEILREDAAAAQAWSPDGFTPLHLAAYFGHSDAVDLLLAHGADARAVARNPMLLTALHSAVAGRHHAIVARLLEHGADVDAAQAGGWTALHAAAQHGDADTVDLLLAHGADRHVQADDGRDAAAMAVQRGHADLSARLGGRGS
jgi:ankyrin repeat protein